MKYFFFFLLLSGLQPASAQVKPSQPYIVVESFIILPYTNKAFFLPNQEITSQLIDGIRKELKAYDPSLSETQALTSQEALSRLIIHEQTEEGTIAYQCDRRDLTIMSLIWQPEIKADRPSWLIIRDYNETPLLRLNYDDALQYLSLHGQGTWYNILNNADSSGYDKALSGLRFQAARVVVRDGSGEKIYLKDTAYKTFSGIPDLDKVLLDLLAGNNLKVNNEVLRTGTFLYKLKCSFSFGATEDLNLPFFGSKREITSIICEAVRKGTLIPYDYPYFGTADTISVDAFVNRMYSDEISPNDDRFLYEEIPERTQYSPSELSIKIQENVDVTDKGRKEKITWLTVIIPAANPSNYKGIDIAIGSFKFSECKKVFQNDPRAIWYHPSNNSDSCNFADAILRKRFRAESLYISDAFEELWSIYKYEKNHVDFLRDSRPVVTLQFLQDTLKKDPYKRELSYFKDYVISFDSTVTPEGYKSIQTNTSFTYNTYRIINLSDPANQILSPNPAELARLIINEIKAGKIDVFGIDGRKLNRDELNSLMIELVRKEEYEPIGDSIYYRTDTISDYLNRDIDRLTYLGLTEKLVIQGKKRIYTPQFITLKDPQRPWSKENYTDLVNIRYSDFISILEKTADSSKKLKLMKGRRFKAVLEAVTDIFGRKFLSSDTEFRNSKRMQEDFKADLSAIPSGLNQKQK